MGILCTSKLRWHSTLTKPILTILPIYRKNIFGKQLSQELCSKYIFRFLHAPKFEIFSTKLNMMVKVVKMFTGVLWKSCSDEFYTKHICRSFFFNKVSRLHNIPAQVYFCEFYQIFQNAVFAKYLWVTASAKYPFVRSVDLSHKKCFLQPWFF